MVVFGYKLEIGAVRFMAFKVLFIYVCILYDKLFNNCVV